VANKSIDIFGASTDLPTGTMSSDPREVTLADNTANRFEICRLYAYIRASGTPAVGDLVNFYLIQHDNGSPAHLSDGASGVTSTIVPVPRNAVYLGSSWVGPSPSSTMYVSFECLLYQPGHKWSILVDPDFVAWSAHSYIRYVGINREIQ
jgi:hypothetical protein